MGKEGGEENAGADGYHPGVKLKPLLGPVLGAVEPRFEFVPLAVDDADKLSACVLQRFVKLRFDGVWHDGSEFAERGEFVGCRAGLVSGSTESSEELSRSAGETVGKRIVEILLGGGMFELRRLSPPPVLAGGNVFQSLPQFVLLRDQIGIKLGLVRFFLLFVSASSASPRAASALVLSAPTASALRAFCAATRWFSALMVIKLFAPHHRRSQFFSVHRKLPPGELRLRASERIVTPKGKRQSAPRSDTTRRSAFPAVFFGAG